MREADELRASAGALEAELSAMRFAEKMQCFRAFDRKGSNALGAAELRVGLKEMWGMEVSENMAMRLLKLLDRNGSGEVELEEFDVAAIEPALEQLSEEVRASKEAARAEVIKRRGEFELQRQLKEYQQTLPGENQDTGIITRLLSVAAYILPLADSLRLGLPLVFLIPPSLMALIWVPFLPLYRATLLFPFAGLVTFLAIQFLAGKDDIPALLRFNLWQAIQLDLFLIVPHLLVSFEVIPETVGFIAYVPGILAFFYTLGCIAYSASLTLCGMAPRGIPKISQDAEKSMGMVPPGQEDDASSQVPPSSDDSSSKA